MNDITPHASENMEKYARLISNFEEMSFKSKVERILDSKPTDSVAVVFELEKPIENPYRDCWQKNDILCGIIRNGLLVTVMTTRKNQVNVSHLRTDRII